MTRREIQRLAQCLHATGPYYQLAFRDQPARLQSSTVAQRVDLACADPAFVWHVAESYGRAALPLPDAPWPSAVQRAYAALRDPNCYDVSVRMVEQLNQPEKKTRRDLLRPLLVCADNSLEQLADLCRVSLDVIGLFETLTWNCRDRCRERIYLARICQVPGFAQNTGWLQEPEDLGCNLLCIAYRLGRTQAVLSAAGLALSPASLCEA